MPLRCVDDRGTSIEAPECTPEQWAALMEEQRIRKHLTMPCCKMQAMSPDFREIPSSGRKMGNPVKTRPYIVARMHPANHRGGKQVHASTSHRFYQM